jgi:beta-galactosidase
VEWFGRGPHENYSDRKTGAKIGIYSASVDELHTPYIRPQENGNRTDVRWAALKGPDGLGLMAVAEDVIEFSALFFDDEDFDEGLEPVYRHAWDSTPGDRITLDLDLRQMGVGGDTSWGARPHPRYRIRAGPLGYRFRLIPFDAAAKGPREIAGERW